MFSERYGETSRASRMQELPLRRYCRACEFLREGEWELV
jgi:hypothetical protein